MSKMTYDDLADLYTAVTGRNARIRPIKAAGEWAETQPDFVTIDDEGYYHLTKKGQEVLSEWKRYRAL